MAVELFHVEFLFRLKIKLVSLMPDYKSDGLPTEPRHEKTCLCGLLPGKTQTDLLSYRD